MPSLLKSEFQDFLSLEGILDMYKSKLHEALPLIIAILAKREILNGTDKVLTAYESLSDYDIETRAKEFHTLPLPIAHKIRSFFLTKELLHSLDSKQLLTSQNQLITQQIDYMLNMPKQQNTGGLLTRCLRGICRIYLRFLKRNLNKLSFG
jgi:hypothetical protein